MKFYRSATVIKIFGFAILACSFAMPGKANSADTLKLVSWGANTWGNVVAYPYYLSFNNNPATEMMCDDYWDEIGQGQQWDVTVHSLTPSNIGSLMFFSEFSNPDSALTAYYAAAYILTGVHGGTIAANYGNAAVWQLFSTPAGKTIPGGNDGTVQGILTDALIYVTTHSNLNYSGIRVYTPTNLGSSRTQEFLEYGVSFSSPVPEPATYALFGAGLIGLAAFGRRRAHLR